MMTILCALLLVVALLACWALTLLGMPGNWLMVALVAVYALFAPAALESRAAIGWLTVGGLCGLACLGEVIEFVAAAAGVAKLGGSKRAAVLALAGSLVGAILGVVIGLPIPVIGSLVAAVLFACLGAMGGAMLGESWAGKQLNTSWRVAKMAFVGRLIGTLGKMLVGAIMVAVAVATLLV